MFCLTDRRLTVSAKPKPTFGSVSELLSKNFFEQVVVGGYETLFSVGLEVLKSLHTLIWQKIVLNFTKIWQWIEGEPAAKMCDYEDLTPNWTEPVIWRNCGGGWGFAKNRNFVKLSLFASTLSARILNMAVKWLIVSLLLWQGKTILAYYLQFIDVSNSNQLALV